MIDIVSIGVILIVVGFGLALIAALWSSSKDESKARVKVGGVVLIGPIPIIFGSNAKWASLAIVLAIILIVLTLFSIYRG
jgi:uncharacterized protein (TIGR00304 family)